MKSLFGATQRSSNPTYAYTPNLPPTEQVSSEHLGTPPPTHPTYAYNSKSPAEQVLEEHLGKPPPSAPDGMTLVQVNGQTHIFNALENYTSKWPLGFQGCYRCGSTATKQGCTPRERCPAFQSCSLSDFFKELHTHKPNLRRRRVSDFFVFFHTSTTTAHCWRSRNFKCGNTYVFGSIKYRTLALFSDQLNTVFQLCFRIS